MWNTTLQDCQKNTTERNVGRAPLQPHSRGTGPADAGPRLTVFPEGFCFAKTRSKFGRAGSPLPAGRFRACAWRRAQECAPYRALCFCGEEFDERFWCAVLQHSFRFD